MLKLRTGGFLTSSLIFNEKSGVQDFSGKFWFQLPTYLMKICIEMILKAILRDITHDYYDCLSKHFKDMSKVSLRPSWRTPTLVIFKSTQPSTKVSFMAQIKLNILFNYFFNTDTWQKFKNKYVISYIGEKPLVCHKSLSHNSASIRDGQIVGIHIPTDFILIPRISKYSKKIPKYFRSRSYSLPWEYWHSHVIPKFPKKSKLSNKNNKTKKISVW